MQPYPIISEGTATFPLNTLGYNVLILNCDLLLSATIFIHCIYMNYTICGC